MGFIKRAWSGQEKLWKVYWLYAMLLGIVAQVVLYGLQMVAAIGGFGMIARIFAMVLFLAYAVWCNVSLWRCAWNAKAKIWGYIVRIIVVISAISYFFMVKSLLPLMISDAPSDSAEMHATVTPGAAPASPAVVANPSAPGVVPAAATPDACEKRMTDFAVQNHADPIAYVAQNQAYLQQCRQAMGISAAAPAAAAPVGAVVPTVAASATAGNPCPATWAGHAFGDTHKLGTQDVCDYTGSVSDAECTAAGAMLVGGSKNNWCQKIENNGAMRLSLMRN